MVSMLKNRLDSTKQVSNSTIIKHQNVNTPLEVNTHSMSNASIKQSNIDISRYYSNHYNSIKHLTSNVCSILHMAIFVTQHIDYVVNGMNYININLSTTHAEDDALQKLKRKLKSRSDRFKYKPFDLIVISVSKTGQLSSSRPCKHCIQKLQRSNINIKNIHYSVNNTMKMEKFVDMVSTIDSAHISKGNRL
jgi:hypothetical protein